MAVDKEFLQNLQDLVASKQVEKEEVIATKDEQIAIKDQEITSKSEEISCLGQMLGAQKDQITGLKKEIWRLKPNGDEMDEIMLRFPLLGHQIFQQYACKM